ncbi:MAG: hypothetical protein ACFE9Q_11210 [Candidatus Hodarchaeota archaeon]
MDINKNNSYKKLKVYAILMTLVSFILRETCSYSMEENLNKSIINNSQLFLSNGVKLVDKVFNFTTSRDFVAFNDNIYFEKPYLYYISFEIVTPHKCDMNISLWDPDGDKYDIYDSRTNGSLLEQFQYQEIPFGIAITGNYTIIFQAYISENLNIHIKIWNSGLQCLQEALSPSAFANRDFYQVNKFKNGQIRPPYNVSLKTNTLYRFYFGRYSPIAYFGKNETKIDFNITSSIDIEYKIYIGEILPGVCQVEYFDFGTAVEGIYIINMTISCMVLCVNIAYAIVEVSKIADGTNPNDTDPPPEDPVNNTKSGVEISVPIGFTIGTLIFLGCIVGIPILIVVIRKRNNRSGL